MEYGPFNPVCDAGSRGKIDEMEAIMTNLGMGTDYVEVPPEAIELVESTYAEWLALNEGEQEETRAYSASVERARQRGDGGWDLAQSLSCGIQAA